MINSEKFKFSDFTLDNYKYLVALAVDKGYKFITYSDNFVADRKDMLWRHDVEFEPDIALRMARIEHELGVKGNYFFQLHCPYYNLIDSHYTKVFNDIKSLGHHVGLHFDSHYFGIENEDQLNEFIELDKSYFEKILKTKIKAFSFHNTTQFTHTCLKRTYAGLINVYSSYYRDNYSYCGDSLGYWRFDRLEEVLMDDSVQHLQVLTHDANWTHDVMSPRKRVKKFLFDRAERLYSEQVKGLESKGMLCPDD